MKKMDLVKTNNFFCKSKKISTVNREKNSRKTQKPKNPIFGQKLHPEKPRKTQKPKNPKTQVLPTLYRIHETS